MAIRGIASYLSTTDSMLQHWLHVEEHTGAPFVLLGGAGRDDLQALRDALASAITEAVGAENIVEGSRFDLAQRRAEVCEIVRQFNRQVRYRFQETHYPRALPGIPPPRAGLGVMVSASDSVANVWALIDANDPPVAGFTPPLIVAGATRAQFVAQIVALQEAYSLFDQAELGLQLARGVRDDVIVPLRRLLLLYRMAVLATFSPGEALVESLPKVSRNRPKKKLEPAERVAGV